MDGGGLDSAQVPGDGGRPDGRSHPAHQGRREGKLLSFRLAHWSACTILQHYMQSSSYKAFSPNMQSAAKDTRPVLNTTIGRCSLSGCQQLFDADRRGLHALAECWGVLCVQYDNVWEGGLQCTGINADVGYCVCSMMMCGSAAMC